MKINLYSITQISGCLGRSQGRAEEMDNKGARRDLRWQIRYVHLKGGDALPSVPVREI